MASKTAQSSMEFMIIVFFVLVSFVTFFLVIQENLSDRMDKRENVEINEIAKLVKIEIDLASDSIDGYRREFNLPPKTSGGDYVISLVEDSVSVASSDGRHAVTLPVRPSTGTLIKSTNVIKKENGKVTLNS